MQDNVIENTAEKPELVDRRKDRDIFVKAINVCSGVAWLFFIAVTMFFLLAQPVNNNIFTSGAPYLEAPYRGAGAVYLGCAFFLMLATLVMCLAGIFINSMRHKRKSDKYNKTLIFFSAVSLLSCVWFIFSFGFPI